MNFIMQLCGNFRETMHSFCGTAQMALRPKSRYPPCAERRKAACGGLAGGRIRNAADFGDGSWSCEYLKFRQQKDVAL